jgi:CheY-like chemotaxis protein
MRVRCEARKATADMKYRILLADDNDDVREVFKESLEKHGFEVVPAATVNEALKLIATEKFDVLLSDLHMPDAGDGFTIVSAMRHTHPNAVTLVISGYPALEEAMSAILLEADEVLVKPVNLPEIAELIMKRLSNPSPRPTMKKERAGVMLERDTDRTIKNLDVPCGAKRGIDGDPTNLHGAYRPSPVATGGPRSSPASRSREHTFNFQVRARTRRYAAQAGLQCSYDGGGIASAAGKHF